MRTIVITGGGRRVGKTALARRLGALLPDSRVVKLGEHARRDDKNPLFFALETSFAEVARAVGECAFLILESGKILDDPGCRPDLVVFLPHPEADKPGSGRRRDRADLVRGRSVDPATAERLQARLDLERQTFELVLEAVAAV